MCVRLEVRPKNDHAKGFLKKSPAHLLMFRRTLTCLHARHHDRTVYQRHLMLSCTSCCCDPALWARGHSSCVWYEAAKMTHHKLLPPPPQNPHPPQMSLPSAHAQPPPPAAQDDDLSVIDSREESRLNTQDSQASLPASSLGECTTTEGRGGRAPTFVDCEKNWYMYAVLLDTSK